MPVDALCAVVAILVHNASRPPLALDCARNKLGNVGGLKLAAVLRGATSLKSLEAADNEFGPGAITALAEALRGVTSLVELGLARNVRTPPYRRPAEMKPRDQQALTEDNDEEGSALEGDHDGINDGSYANRTRGVPSVRLVRFIRPPMLYASSTLAATHAAMRLPMSCRRFYSISRAARRSHQQTSPVIARARRPESSAPCSTSSDARASSATSTHAATALIRRASARSLADGAGGTSPCSGSPSLQPTRARRATDAAACRSIRRSS